MISKRQIILNKALKKIMSILEGFVVHNLISIKMKQGIT